MKKFLVLAVAVFCCVAAHGAEVTGHVSLMRQDVAMNASNVVVRIVESPVAFPTNRTGKPVLKLTESRFTDPLVFVVLANEPFEIHNTSGKLFNLHLNFRANKPINTAIVAASDGKPFIKRHEGVAKPEMYARITDDLGQVNGYVCVLEHAGYTMSSNSGDYRLNLEPGTYTLEVALPGFPTKREAITIGKTPLKRDFVLSK